MKIFKRYLKSLVSRGISIPRKGRKAKQDKVVAKEALDTKGLKKPAAKEFMSVQSQSEEASTRKKKASPATGEKELKQRVTRKTTKRARVKEHDIDKLLDEIFSQVDSIFSLTTYLGLSPDKAREVVREILDNVVSSYSSRPSTEAVLKKIKRNADIISEYIASKLLELEDKLSINQLEFIVLKGGRSALKEAERLFKLALKYSRDDIVSALRNLWNISGPRGLLECPKCGFNSITPERICLICGNIVKDEYIRERLSFSDKFETYLKTASVAELNETMQAGFILLGERGIYSPRSRKARIENPIVYVIYLNPAELSRIVEEIGSRELSI